MSQAGTAPSSSPGATDYLALLNAIRSDSQKSDRMNKRQQLHSELENAAQLAEALSLQTAKSADAAKATASDRLSWVRIPGASVFELRARAVERARGEIVALTEDHCIVGTDWCAEILEAFRRNPNAMAVTGPVLNGSTERLIDWANFLHTFGSSFPPMDKDQGNRAPPAANVAFRRSAIGAGPLDPGWLELELSGRLFREQLFCVHEGITVTHVQSHGFWGTLQAHFDNGRSTTGLRRESRRRVQRPWDVFGGAWWSLSRDARSLPAVRASVPLMVLLSCCHWAGEMVGALAGPGRSPARLR
jgi:hypothetical protein